MSYFEGMWDFIIYGTMGIAILWGMYLFTKFWKLFYNSYRLRFRKYDLMDIHKIIRIKEIASKKGYDLDKELSKFFDEDLEKDLESKIEQELLEELKEKKEK